MALEVLLTMMVEVVLWNSRVWVGIRVGRVGLGEAVRVGWVNKVGIGRGGCKFGLSMLVLGNFDCRGFDPMVR